MQKLTTGMFLLESGSVLMVFIHFISGMLNWFSFMFKEDFVNKHDQTQISLISV